MKKWIIFLLIAIFFMRMVMITNFFWCCACYGNTIRSLLCWCSCNKGSEKNWNKDIDLENIKKNLTDGFTNQRLKLFSSCRGELYTSESWLKLLSKTTRHFRFLQAGCEDEERETSISFTQAKIICVTCLTGS